MSIFNKLVENAKRLAPASLSPEKRFARALITGSALVALADGTADDGEINRASQIIAGHKSIKEYLVASEAHEMFSDVVQELQKAYRDPMNRLLEVNKRVAEIADTVKEPHYRQQVIEFAGVMGASNERGCIGSAEQAVIDKLKAALV